MIGKVDNRVMVVPAICSLNCLVRGEIVEEANECHS